MRIITCNLNGIRAAVRKGFLPWLLAQDADVVCLQEIKAQAAQLPPECAALPGYNGYFCDAHKKGYSGVGIYARRAPDRVVRGLGWPDIDREARFLQLDFGDVSMVSLYVPSGTMGPARQAVKYDFLERFKTELARMRSDGRRYLLCGDFNIAHRAIDLYDPVRNAATTGFLPPERAWFDAMIAGGWVDAFRVVNDRPKEYTWWSGWPQAWERNLGWRIDYQIVSPALALAVRSAAIYKGERFSDHAPLTVDYDL